MAAKKDTSGRKTAYPHSEMRSAAKWALEVASSVEEGSYYQSLLCCMATAFCLEGYFNYLGEHEFPKDWDSEHERKEPKERLKILAKKVGYKLDYKTPEYDAFTRVFALRKALVHGQKTEVTGKWNYTQNGKGAVSALNTEWEKSGYPEAAGETYYLCIGLVGKLHEKSSMKGPAFPGSRGIAHSKVEQREAT